MLNLYTSPSCTSCRKAKAWLKEHDISFKERNIFANPLNKEEIMQVLRMTENGTEEIISTRSRTFQNLKINLDDFSFWKPKHYVLYLDRFGMYQFIAQSFEVEEND